MVTLALEVPVEPVSEVNKVVATSTGTASAAEDLERIVQGEEAL
jgi:hypothetical protein